MNQRIAEVRETFENAMFKVTMSAEKTVEAAIY